jgi:hypothetical protein
VAGEQKRFLLIQAALSEAGEGVAQMRFEFSPVIRREAGLRASSARQFSMAAFRS